ncbi:sigma54 specific transcriptional regulator, Fis family [Nitrosospira multiformis ATCC 25196]|uniref:Sigma54 specific transcriptional regulator, Fis family n=1 Tax=Nitrosospira multiformis (strain ATCC 25196 / NCIMB 11849 / C 71) TaxID=323848 RepID=Q2Y750_NITMU|nr:sigma 54-interacting transcriptional regulator [Nitrosospira multiformis]ABB75421.1 sigma54 specific transcriptional regulator, Fis family [Nitrosospira multiformis ATCC 25196]SEF86761.1 sigma54 specific transcriptional regulator, Fis family [Nitrosospira multiformis ATCC 25196]
MIGQSPAFAKVTQFIEKIAGCDAPVLIEGETGTGKELAARAIHDSGARRNGAFVPINCRAIPDTLIENELFGHERDSCIGGSPEHPNPSAPAQSGTLFLDEADALSPKAQVTLLRFFQDQEYLPLGRRIARSANRRIIIASNRNLGHLAEKGEFRLDLLFRLKIMYLTLPPLRERQGDAALLADYFLRECSARFNRGNKTLHPNTVAWFDKYNWPGNIRELENLIYREYLLADEDVINIASLAPTVAERRSGFDRRLPELNGLSFAEAKNRAIAAFEQYYLAEAMVRAQGNVTRAASLVGKDRRAFGKLLKKHSMSKNKLFLEH